MVELITLLADRGSPAVRRSRHRQLPAEPAFGYPQWLTAGSGAMVRRPVALVLLLLLGVLVPAGHGQQAGARLLVVDLLVVALLVVTGYRLLATGIAARIRLSAAAALVVLPVAAACVTVTAVDGRASLVGLLRESEIFVLIPLAVALSLEGSRDLIAVLLGLLGVGLLEAAVSLGQWGTGSAAGAGAVGWTGTFGGTDVAGLPLTVTVALVAAVAIALVFPGRARVAASLAAGCCGLWLAVDGRPAAVVAALTATALVLVLARAPRATGPLAGGLLCALVLGAVAFVAVGQLDANPSPGSGSRISRDVALVNGMAPSLFVDHPATGVGLRNYPVVRDTYAPIDLSGTGGAGRVDFPSNLYLLVISEQGLLGICVLLGVLAATAAGCSRQLVRHPPARPGTAAGARLGGLAAAGLLATFAFGGINADLGAPSTVAAAVALGVVLWWAMAPADLPEPR